MDKITLIFNILFPIFLEKFTEFTIFYTQFDDKFIGCMNETRKPPKITNQEFGWGVGYYKKSVLYKENEYLQGVSTCIQ